MAGEASCSSSAAAPSSKKLYDAFISFRGEDTRRNFTAHLHAALSRNHIRTFKDNINLEKGDEAWPALVHAIDNSYVCIVVFSKHYASSTWCLRELTHILECKKDKQVLPVFYQIDPSHIRKQTGSYKDAFDKYEKNLELDEKTIKKWKAALKKAADISGFDSESKDYSDEHQLIENIVKDAWQKLAHIYPKSKSEVLVGNNKSFADMDMLLREYKIIGLWGMGGIGKTTIAKAAFSRHSSQYESHCFLENIRESSGNKTLGLQGLRIKLLTELLKGDNVHIDADSDFVKSRLSDKTVLIVLDDVDALEQIEFLVGEINCFGPGSRIIITTRDRHVLNGRVDKTYAVERLDYQESLKLFSLNAFSSEHPQTEFEELSKKVVCYAQGLPLALKLLGSYLRSRSKEAWEGEFEKLKKYPHKPIENVLRLSYDKLEGEEKEIFLDIAFFFKGERKQDVENFLNACNFCTIIGLKALQNKALITISNQGRVEMHDLIQEMGWARVREECIKSPGGRTRLRDPKEIYDVLKNNEGSIAIEGIILDLSQIQDLHLSGDSFQMMTKLRILKFYFPDFWTGRGSCKLFPSGLESFPGSLRYFRWDGYSSKSLPSTLCLKKLVELDIQYSQVKNFGNGAQDLANLRSINLMGSTSLVELPNFPKAFNLESINLSYCSSLRHVPSAFCSEKLVRFIMCNTSVKKLWNGVQNLASLKEIDLSGSKELIELPNLSKALNLKLINISYCKNLHHVPTTFCAKKLVRFIMCGTYIKKLWYEVQDFASLKEIDLSGSKELIELPNLSMALNLESVNLSYCKNLRHMSTTFCAEKLVRAIICGSHFKKLWDGVQNLASLKEIDLSGSKELIELPNLSKALNLELINISYCKNLGHVPATFCAEKLVRFIMRGTHIKKLWDGVQNLESLEEIDLSRSTRLIKLPNLSKASKLRQLNLSCCDDIKSLKGIEYLSSLQYIDISNCKRLQFLPQLPLLLKRLDAEDCTSLEKVRITPMTSTDLDEGTSFLRKGLWMSFKNCTQLDRCSINVIQLLALARIKVGARFDCDHPIQICFPGYGIPFWFRYKTIGSQNRLTINLPLHSDPLGFAFCLCFYVPRSNSDSEFDFDVDFSNIKIECKCYLVDSEIFSSKCGGYRWHRWHDDSYYDTDFVDDYDDDDEGVEEDDGDNYHDDNCYCTDDSDDDDKLRSHVFLWYDKIAGEVIMKAIQERRAKLTSCNPTLSFQFEVWGSSYGRDQKLDRDIRECGVWPVYASH